MSEQPVERIFKLAERERRAKMNDRNALLLADKTDLIAACTGLLDAIHNLTGFEDDIYAVEVAKALLARLG